MWLSTFDVNGKRDAQFSKAPSEWEGRIAALRRSMMEVTTLVVEPDRFPSMASSSMVTKNTPCRCPSTVLFSILFSTHWPPASWRYHWFSSATERSDTYPWMRTGTPFNLI
ncbi:hypothetical protein D9M68_902690 [compost metagenome]